jgi:hypothetical protein
MGGKGKRHLDTCAISPLIGVYFAMHSSKVFARQECLFAKLVLGLRFNVYTPTNVSVHVNTVGHYCSKKRGKCTNKVRTVGFRYGMENTCKKHAANGI